MMSRVENFLWRSDQATSPEVSAQWAQVAGLFAIAEAIRDLSDHEKTDALRMIGVELGGIGVQLGNISDR